MIRLEECIKWLETNAFKKVCLQIPNHLMVQAVDVALYLRKNSSAQIYIIGDAAYENCCSDKLSADHIQADACIHFGHACLSCVSDLPTFYVFPKQDLDVNTFCEDFYKYFENESREILFFYDILYAHHIELIYEKLRLKYKNLVITMLNCSSDVKFVTATDTSGTTILGRCFKLPDNQKSDNYDAVFLGPNDKTLIALAMSLPIKAWHYFDSSIFQEYNILSSLWLKRRNFLIEKIKEAQTFGILIASLNIKDYLKITEVLKSILKKVNKKIYLFSVGKISPTKLANFAEVDIFVAVACPESSLLNSRDYFKPIVTPFEVDLAFNGARSFSYLHAIDFKQMLPGGLNYEDFQVNAETEISLASGKVVNYADNTDTGDSSTLVKKSVGEIMKSQIDPNFLQSRSWSGLEQKLGETEVSLAVSGREGIPVNYVNELL